MKLPQRRPRRWAFYGAAMATSTLMTFKIALWPYTLALAVLLGIVWVIKGDK